MDEVGGCRVCEACQRRFQQPEKSKAECISPVAFRLASRAHIVFKNSIKARLSSSLSPASPGIYWVPK